MANNRTGSPMSVVAVGATGGAGDKETIPRVRLVFSGQSSGERLPS